MKFALIGHPLAGSLSPRLFCAAYDGRYPYALIERKAFEDAWNLFLADYDGINVTAPFKQDAFARVDSLSQEARSSGAVNLVVRQSGKLHGYNTDVDGIVMAVKECGLPLADALVVGTGGAARAAIVAARRLGCRVAVTGRSTEKVRDLVAHSGCQSVAWEGLENLRPDLLIYTLPGHTPVPAGLNPAASVVLEAEYKNPALRSLPCKAYLPGQRWLLGQAVTGYRLLTGEEPDVEKMLKVL